MTAKKYITGRRNIRTFTEQTIGRKEAAELLEFPENMDLFALVSIGCPAETPAAPKCKTVEDLLFYNSVKSKGICSSAFIWEKS